MLISTATSSWEKFGSHEQVIKMIKDAGFPAYDFTIYPDKVFPLREECWLNKKTLWDIRDSIPDNFNHTINIEQAKKLREYSDKINIVCNQTHAPFPTMRKNDSKYNEYVFPFIVESIKISSILGAKICVVHPCNDYSAKENSLFYKRLESVAKEYGVKIALENMWNRDVFGRITKASCSSPNDFNKHLDLLNENIFCACLDLGHAEIKGVKTSAVEMIYALKGRLKALHIHDNDLINDSHALPYTLSIDFDSICKALKDIGYEGDITFETDRFAPKFPVELYPSCARFLYEIGAFIKDKVKGKD